MGGLKLRVIEVVEGTFNGATSYYSLDGALLAINRAGMDLPPSPMESLEVVEHRHIANVLSCTQSLDDAAKVLGVNVSTLWRKRQRYGLE